MITREEYMKDSAKLHNAYWEQFVTPEVIALVNRNISTAEIKSSEDKYFNDIKLVRWDSLYYQGLPQLTLKLRQQAKEDNSLGASVCIAKAAARIIKESK